MPQNGQMVRNKQTGEMGIFQNGQVVPVDSALPGGPISSGVNPSDVIAQRNANRSDAQFQHQVQRDQTADARLAAEDEEKAAATAKAEEAALFKLMQVINVMNEVGLDANDNKSAPGLGETGGSGNFMRGMPIVNNPAKDLSANIDTLRANYAFDALQAMRDASKTGGALGQVSEIELQLLERAVANVDPNQSHEQFLANLQRARQAYLAKLAMIQPELATRLGYDAGQAETAMLELNDAFNKEFGGNVEMSVKREHAASGWGKAQVID